MTDILNPEEAADYLHINDQTVRRYAREGTIPAFRLGGQWRFKKSALDQWTDNQSAANQSRQPQEVPKPKKLILVVDDEPVVRMAMEGMLTGLGYRTLCVAKGSEALPAIRQETPLMVFLDMIMPDMNGAEVYAAIHREFQNLPVVIVTGFGDSEILAQALRVSPAVVLAKPFTSEHLKEAVKRFDPSISAEVNKAGSAQAS